MNRRMFVTSASALALSAPMAMARAQPRIGLIFVGAGSCPYCSVIAPVLWNLAQDTGMPVLLASMDGQPVGPFGRFEDGTVHPLTMGFQSVPHILIWHRDLDQVTHKVSGFRNPHHFTQLLSAAMSEASQL